ncbi:hypothetical protein [Deinococcus fonticola]|uniref:hypothetical protein n=1 Tax=Deinococcus fonticola TaxID=2528713 RepID=UPI001074A7AE|nr:hypothetical protein [Deinococcus fonticola]
MRGLPRLVAPWLMVLSLLMGLSLEVGAQSVTRAGLTVNYRDPADRAQLAQVFQVWQKAGQDLKVKGLTLPAATLTAARSANDFAALTGSPPHIAAITLKGKLYTQRLAALRGKQLLPYTLRHEAFHLAQPPDLPRWLAEGLARIFSGESGLDAPGRTGLEGLSEKDLDTRLAQASGPGLTRVYREATRRAGQRLERQGWPATLNPLHSRGP